ncbi:MAG TPA: hypothetical protein VN688_30690 [Gemmataceae bacterium]|nr:hypothetical protein [Gemmataceae bacterium]
MLLSFLKDKLQLDLVSETIRCVSSRRQPKCRPAHPDGSPDAPWTADGQTADNTPSAGVPRKPYWPAPNDGHDDVQRASVLLPQTRLRFCPHLKRGYSPRTHPGTAKVVPG